MPPEIVFEHEGQPKVHLVSKDELTIGRASDNDLMIPNALISRCHAKISRDGGTWRISDLGSKNGTQVNGVAAVSTPLKHGDQILLGQFPVTFREQSAGVVLMAPGGTALDDASRTVFRAAIGFDSLANKPPAARTPQMDVDRLRRLLGIVSEISRDLLASKPLEATLERVLELVFEHLPVERGCIVLRETSGELTPRVVRGRANKGETDMTISRTIAEKVVKDRVSVLTTDAMRDPRFATGASVLAQKIRSAMAAPLWAGDRVEGLIYVDTPLQAEAFEEFDLDLLSALGNHAALAIEQSRLQESVMQERLTRQKLERYHSPAVIERITRGETLGGMEAEERDVTILFADAVGFTERSERMEPREVAQFLNRLFSRMTDMIFLHEGTLDKFVGDGIMAVFGAPLETKDHAVHAVRAALDMKEALRQLNSEVGDDQRVDFRMGLHSGRVVAGDIGSAKRSDYTVLGASVNLAARIQSNVAEPGQIIISDATREQIGDQFETRFVGEFQPKGISRMVRCYELLGVKP